MCTEQDSQAFAFFFLYDYYYYYLLHQAIGMDSLAGQTDFQAQVLILVAYMYMHLKVGLAHLQYRKVQLPRKLGEMVNTHFSTCSKVEEAFDDINVSCKIRQGQ